MNHCLFKPDVVIDLFIKAVGVSVAIVGAYAGLLEYQKKQRWMKSEFLAKEMKDFLSDFDVKRALWMIDWHAFKIPLAEGEIDGMKSFDFDNNLLMTSLSWHIDRFNGKLLPKKGEEYNPTETQIRLIFDSLFQKLGAFQTYVDNQLITYSDLEHYIAYYLRILHDKKNERKPEQLKEQIMRFIEKYEYTQAKKLIDYYCIS